MVTGGKVNGAFHEPSGGRKRGGGHKFKPSQQNLGHKREGNHGQSILLLPGASGGGLPEKRE